MKKLLIILGILLSIILLVILYSPIGSPSNYQLDSHTIAYHTPKYEALPSSAGLNYKPSITTEYQAEPIQEMSNVNTPSVTAQMTYTSSQISTQQSVSNYSHENTSTTSPSYPNIPLLTFQSSHSQSMSQVTPIESATSLSETKSEDKAEALSIAQRCHDHSTDCGRWVWHKGYWSYWWGCKGKHWVDGYWEYVYEDCPPGVPIGDGILILVALAMVYVLFKKFKLCPKTK